MPRHRTAFPVRRRQFHGRTAVGKTSVNRPSARRTGPVHRQIRCESTTHSREFWFHRLLPTKELAQGSASGTPLAALLSHQCCRPFRRLISVRHHPSRMHESGLPCPGTRSVSPIAPARRSTDSLLRTHSHATAFHLRDCQQRIAGTGQTKAEPATVLTLKLLSPRGSGGAPGTNPAAIALPALAMRVTTEVSWLKGM